MDIKNLKLFCFGNIKKSFYVIFTQIFINIVHDKIIIMSSVHGVVNISILLNSGLLSSIIYWKICVETKF